MSVRCLLLVFVASCAGLVPIAAAQSFSPSHYDSLRWRMIGPFRGGRTVGATGVPGQPNVFYIGVNNGGVWKSTDYGRVWKPIFDDQPTGSIGALAVAPSSPNILYVGSGEGLQRPDLSTGDGMYRSTDAGKTWQHLGLRDGQQIAAIVVDPKNADRLFVAVLGHPYGPNAERGVFRSTDGGKTFQKVLYKDENTGAVALAFDPANAQTVYAVLWAARQGPWENGAWQGPHSGLFKSTDGGTHWTQLKKGLPTTAQGLGRIGIAVAPSDPKCLYAMVDAPRLGGVYRSDDAGESWRRVHSAQRVWGRGSDFAEVKVDPKNKDIVYAANTSAYRSTDGGKTFTAFKGAPGGDDYHTFWINPDNPQILLLATDQGATISVNGGKTWSSWYNQPTAQFYHVSTDNQFPYWVYGGQQESGSAGVCSRGNEGQITFRDWRTVGVEEYGYVAPDPLDPNIIYGGKVSRFDRRTGQVQDVGPTVLRSGRYRTLRTAPVLFSPVDPHVLYFGANVLFKTKDGGKHWEIISPDLSREKPDVPECVGVYRDKVGTLARRGVIYTVAPSYKDVNTLWAGTDDGLIHVTRDGGKTWKDVTPPGVTSWSKVSIIDAGRFDAATAYAAVNRIRCDDQRPHIYRTHDYGKTWKEIVSGLPNDPVNAVREDPVRKGLLFAGTERAVHVSFDDGDSWQPLRLNMPATSIRDLVVHRDDVVVGTHGRSFWILDDISPLRQLSADVAAAPAHLFEPQMAYRYRRSTATDTPLPPEEPAGKNPPDGAILYYHLKTKSSGPVILEIFNDKKGLVRRYSSADLTEPVAEGELNVPLYWLRPPQVLSAEAGSHRFAWDLYYTPLDGGRGRRSYPISAIYGDTPPSPTSPLAHPGAYTVRLTVDGRRCEQPLTLKMDPRVKMPPEGLAQQFTLSMNCYEGMKQARTITAQIQRLRTELQSRGEEAKEDALKEAMTTLEKKLSALAGAAVIGRGFRGGRGGGSREASFALVQGEMGQLLRLLQRADATPTSQVVAACGEAQKTFGRLMERWREFSDKELKTLNEKLREAKVPPISLGGGAKGR
jgi:photosystem II stability/assembly factor-like uncharacterized protein